MEKQIASLFQRKHVTIIYTPDQDAKNTIDYRLIDTALAESTGFYEISLKANKPPYDLAKSIEHVIETERHNETAFGRQFTPEWYLIDLAPVETYYNDLDHHPEFCDQLVNIDALAQNENAKIVLIMAASDAWMSARLATTYLAEKAPTAENHFTILAVTRKYPLQLTIANGKRENQTIDFPPDEEPVY